MNDGRVQQKTSCSNIEARVATKMTNMNGDEKSIEAQRMINAGYEVNRGRVSVLSLQGH